MKNLFSALLFGLLPAMAQAGDPSPISVNIRDLGTPDWLDRDALLDQLQQQRSWIGITFAHRDDGIELTFIHPDSAAAIAGLKAGDRVSMINETPMTDDDRRNAMFDALGPDKAPDLTRRKTGRLARSFHHLQRPACHEVLVNRAA